MPQIWMLGRDFSGLPPEGAILPHESGHGDEAHGCSVLTSLPSPIINIMSCFVHPTGVWVAELTTRPQQKKHRPRWVYLRAGTLLVEDSLWQHPLVYTMTYRPMWGIKWVRKTNEKQPCRCRARKAERTYFAQVHSLCMSLIFSPQPRGCTGWILGLESQDILRVCSGCSRPQTVLSMYTRTFFPSLGRPWATFSPPLQEPLGCYIPS